MEIIEKEIDFDGRVVIKLLNNKTKLFIDNTFLTDLEAKFYPESIEISPLEEFEMHEHNLKALAQIGFELDVPNDDFFNGTANLCKRILKALHYGDGNTIRRELDFYS